MEKSKPKVSFFFGAEAEVAYGMPSGGEFALEIFRSISSKDKDQLKEQLAQVETTSNQILFTKSGTKPLTSITMSRRYIDYYDASKKSDVIIVIGYGFNADDGHINTLLRSLIDDENKKLVVLDYNCNDVGQRKKEIQRSLRCDKKSNIHEVSVDAERLVDGKSWLGAVVEKMH